MKQKTFLVVLVSLMMMGRWGIVNAEQKNITQADNVISDPATQYAAKGGVTSCLNRMNQLNRFVAATNQTGAFVFVADKDANKKVVSTSLEVQTQGSSSYASSSVAPVGSEGCGGLYEVITYRPFDCKKVATKEFSAFKAVSLGKDIQAITIAKSGRIFLMPAGRGCNVIKKEVIF